MKNFGKLSIFVGLLLFLFATQALAVSNYAVISFQVNGPSEYKYLEKALPDMLSSRLHWQDHFHPIAQSALSKIGMVNNESEAAKIQSALDVSKLIWGNMTIVGNNCSLDVKVRSNNGSILPKSIQSTINNLIPTVQNLADSIAIEAFNKPVSKASTSSTSAPKIVHQMNPELMHNETQPQQVYMNPQFRYSGYSGDDSMIRTQHLDYASSGFVVTDLNGDGKNEIAIIGQSVVTVYRYEENTLREVTKHEISLLDYCLNIRVGDITGNGKQEILVNAQDERGGPNSFILSFDGANLHVLADKLKYYFNIVKIPSAEKPILIGQSSDPSTIVKGGVYEMVQSGATFTTSSKLGLPKEANVFNFTYYTDETGQNLLAVLSGSEKLQVYSSTGTRLSESEEKYSGSAISIVMPNTIKGMGVDRDYIPDMFYIPQRMIPVKFSSEGRQELLVNRPISTAAQFFERYRFFPQGEIHALYWDGVGMNLLWKTRRIKGSVVDFQVSDLNNDGITDLIVLINTHPGALGFKARKTIILAYPLDLGKTDPYTSTDVTEVFDTN